VVYAGVGHVSIVVALVAPWLRIAPVLDDVESFVRELSEEENTACAAPSLPSEGISGR
jgi:hypothetical protein